MLALRGHASIQGSTDVPTLFNLLPGYLAMPKAGEAAWPTTSTASRARTRKASGATPIRTWSRCSRSTGARALRRRTTTASTTCHGSTATTARTARSMDMVDGKVFGYFLLGQNPAVGSAHGRLQRLGMANLDWLVVRDLVEIESATFWKDGPEVETGEISPADLPDRGVLFPGGVACREGGYVHADAADAAVA